MSMAVTTTSTTTATEFAPQLLLARLTLRDATPTALRTLGARIAALLGVDAAAIFVVDAHGAAVVVRFANGLLRDQFVHFSDAVLGTVGVLSAAAFEATAGPTAPPPPPGARPDWLGVYIGVPCGALVAVVGASLYLCRRDRSTAAQRLLTMHYDATEMVTSSRAHERL